MSSITPSNHCQNVKFLPGKLSCKILGLKKGFQVCLCLCNPSKQSSKFCSLLCLLFRVHCPMFIVSTNGSSVCEMAKTWCSCNLMRVMVCGYSFCHHQLLWARKRRLQPFTLWTNMPITKTLLPMRRSSRLQNGAAEGAAEGAANGARDFLCMKKTNSKSLFWRTSTWVKWLTESSLWGFKKCKRRNHLYV